MNAFANVLTANASLFISLAFALVGLLYLRQLKNLSDASTLKFILSVISGLKFLWTDISGKAALYAIPLFLTPFIDKVGNLLFNGTWPSFPMLVGCTLLGVSQTAIGLRAFYDGSYQRDKDEKSSKNPTQTETAATAAKSKDQAP